MSESKPEEKSTLEVWCILELMGHVRLAGRVTEEQRFGSTIGRIDIPGPDDTFTTIWFGGGSIYRCTATTEAIARSVAAHKPPEPVHRWEMPKLTGAAARDSLDHFDEPTDDDDDTY